MLRFYNLNYLYFDSSHIKKKKKSGYWGLKCDEVGIDSASLALISRRILEEKRTLLVQ